jgi:hypothetical protein
MEAQELLSHTTKWTEKMYDMQWDKNDDNNEVLQYVRHNGGNGIVYIEYSYKQIGLTDEWLREMYNKISNPLVVKREILLQRLRGSSDSPFDQSDIEYITQCIRPIISELYLLENYRFDIYKELERTKPYIVSIDCSTGTNSDSNAITILDPYIVEPVAEFKCPYIGETQFEKLIIELVRKYIPRAIVVIERNSVGDGIIDHLLNSSISQNIYFDKNRDLVEQTMVDNQNITSMLKKQAEQKKYYGVYTGNTSRDDMIAILFRHMAEYKEKFITQNITEDISRLVRTKTGKVEAGPGFHDDSVMSYLIGLYVYYHGNNLAMFGFVKGSEEIKNQNQGMKTYDDVTYTGIIPQRDIDIIKKQELVRKENNYEEMMKLAILKSQQESMTLYQKGLIHNGIIESTPEGVLEDYSQNGELDMSLFDDLNGF